VHWPGPYDLNPSLTQQARAFQMEPEPFGASLILPNILIRLEVDSKSSVVIPDVHLGRNTVTDKETGDFNGTLESPACYSTRINPR
jgi:hypothetical protein